MRADVASETKLVRPLGFGLLATINWNIFDPVGVCLFEERCFHAKALLPSCDSDDACIIGFDCFFVDRFGSRKSNYTSAGPSPARHRGASLWRAKCPHSMSWRWLTPV